MLHILQTSWPCALRYCGSRGPSPLGETVRKATWVSCLVRLRDFHVQLIIPHWQFAVGLQRQVGVYYHRRFYPNLGQFVFQQLVLHDSWPLTYPQHLWADVSKKM